MRLEDPVGVNLGPVLDPLEVDPLLLRRARIQGGDGERKPGRFTLTDQLRKGGRELLQVLKSESIERHVDTPDGMKAALDTLVIARRPL